ncbi:protein NDRG3-like isoform X2 [Dysidea avara]|uniref:protein NDRG3-like isoform X2 n=1 Tax=Dysidea avara TaxID=196820 RepID=UPI003318A504
MACNVPLLEAEQIPELKCTGIVVQRRESSLQARSCFSGRYLEHVAGKPASQISLVDNNRMEYVATGYGDVSVTIQGDENCPAIVTYHDVVCNHEICFEALFGLSEMVRLFHLFCWYHIDAPGQETSAQRITGESYPTMTELAEQVNTVVNHFNLQQFIGIGVGVGANILSRVAMMYPAKVGGLVLVNLSPTAVSWADPEWLIQKNPSQVGNATLLEIFWGYLCCCDLNNTSYLMESHTKRSSIAQDMVEMIKCPCLFVMGRNSYYKDDVFQIAAQLDKTKTTVLQMESDGLLLEDAVEAFFTALKLFVQGLGHATGLGAVSPGASSSFIKAIQLQQSVLSHLD